MTASHLILLLIGGLAASLGPGWWASRPAARSALSRLSGWGLSGIIVAVLVVAAAGLYATVAPVLEAFPTAPSSASPLRFLLAGLLAGLPLSSPTVVARWHAARSRRRKAAGPPATKDDRREFADRIAGQIRDVTRPPRDVTASIAGDGGRVLLFRGDLSSEEGDRLVAALRDEMSDLGFKRVEGEGPGGGWWARV